MGKHAQSRRALLLIMACLLLIAIGPTHAQNTRTGVSPCTIAAEPTALQRLDDGRNGSREQIGLAVWSPNGEQIAVWISRTSTLQAVSDPENWLQIWDAAQGSGSSSCHSKEMLNPRIFHGQQIALNSLSLLAIMFISGKGAGVVTDRA